MFGSILSAGASLLGGALGRSSQRQANDDNAALQKEFAQNGIRWKVEDAKAAGIHPLYALGAQTPQASPSYVGGDTSWLQNAGQDIGRAIDAKRTPQERTNAKIEALAVERGELENDLLRSQIARINQAGHPPALPSGGPIEEVPSKITSSRSGDPALEAAPPAPAVKQFINKDGSITEWPSADAKQAVEDSLYEYEHMLRNRIIPSFKRFWQDGQNKRQKSRSLNKHLYN